MKNLTSRQTGPLSVKELSTAQFTWILSCQRERFDKEIQNLKLSQNAKACLPLVRQLQLYLDNGGYLRCGGRIHNAPLSESTRFPFLLPSKHPLTALIVLATHVTILRTWRSKQHCDCTWTKVLDPISTAICEKYTEKLCGLPKSLW